MPKKETEVAVILPEGESWVDFDIPVPPGKSLSKIETVSYLSERSKIFIEESIERTERFLYDSVNNVRKFLEENTPGAISTDTKILRQWIEVIPPKVIYPGLFFGSSPIINRADFTRAVRDMDPARLWMDILSTETLDTPQINSVTLPSETTDLTITRIRLMGEIGDYFTSLYRFNPIDMVGMPTDREESAVRTFLDVAYGIARRRREQDRPNIPVNIPVGVYCLLALHDVVDSWPIDLLEEVTSMLP